MKSLLKYSYTSSILRISSVSLSTSETIDIVLASNGRNIIDVSFQRPGPSALKLGYKNAVKIMRSTISAIHDVLATKNKMIDSLGTNDVIIEIKIMSLVVSRRLRMYSSLIEKHAPAMESHKDIPFRHVKTDVTNDAIKIFIQRA